MIELFVSAFVTLFVVIDPPGCAPIYASMTTGANAQQRRSMAIRAVIVAGGILLVFAFLSFCASSAARAPRSTYKPQVTV